jgi:hypothetical protein
MANFVIRNQTVEELVLANGETVLKLPPLHRTRICADPAKKFGQAAIRASRDNVVVWEAEPIRSSRLLAITWCAALAVLAVLAGGVGYLATGRVAPAVVGVVAAAGLLVVALAVNLRNRGDGSPRTPVRDDGALRSAPPRGDGWEVARDLLVGSSHGFLGGLLLIAGIAAPGAAIYYGTGLSTVVRIDSWHEITVLGGPDAYGIVVGRLLLLVTVILVSLVPALMYFQFDREKLNTLIDRWLHAIFRLDPSLRTVADVDAKYGRRVEEYYGAWLTSGVDPPRRRARSRSPLVVATLLIGTGWLLVLLHGGAEQDASAGRDVRELFEPSLTPMTAAFLGAYFLGIQVTLRGYVRGDLRPKTYNVITVRIILAVIASWLLQALFGDSYPVLAASFLAGFLPHTALQRIREVAGQARPPWRRGQPEPRDEWEDMSLTVLDGMDIYERTRLEEEGITGVQALARHDLVDLILSSRIPVPRLIDWLDQALLYQHASAQYAQLRARGIRTATDFLQVAGDPEALHALCEDGGPNLRPALLVVALRNDEWLSYVTNWRTADVTKAPHVRRYTCPQAPSRHDAVGPPDPAGNGRAPRSLHPA